jgi:hypothetical protein
LLHAPQDLTSGAAGVQGRSVLNLPRVVYAEQDPFAIFPPQTADHYWTLFDAAARDVRHLLESDSYPRYLNSTLFAELLQSVSLAERLHADAGVHPQPHSSVHPGSESAVPAGKKLSYSSRSLDVAAPLAGSWVGPSLPSPRPYPIRPPALSQTPLAPLS